MQSWQYCYFHHLQSNDEAVAGGGGGEGEQERGGVKLVELGGSLGHEVGDELGGELGEVGEEDVRETRLGERETGENLTQCGQG